MLLEREEELGLLERRLDELGRHGGGMVLVRGEAGIGKTALVRELAERSRSRAHVLVGVCDDYSTPQPLGPIWDVARNEPTVAAALTGGDRREVFEALLSLLSRALRPTLLILEDTHWADEATLDVVKFLGRRVNRTNGLVVLTYRDGDVDADHPLRRIMGDLPPGNLSRVRLAPLSANAVARMAAAGPFTAARLMELTGGNPLFVSEVIASGEDRVPASVQDSILARAARLTPGAKRVLEVVSVAPSDVPGWVVDSIALPEPGDVALCIQRGFLLHDSEDIGFRHELQRRAIEASLSDGERRRLNRAMLKALRDSGDPSVLAHHARESGDIDALVEFTPRAARAAVAAASHREAISHYRALDPYLDRLEIAEQSEILVDWAREEFFTDSPDSIEILDRGIALYRSSGDERGLARTLALGVRMNELHGRPERSDALAQESVAILERFDESEDLANALSQTAWLRLMRGDDDVGGIELADRAIEIAQRFGDELTTCRALITKGAILHSSEDRSAVREVEEGLRLAERGGYQPEEVYALINLGGLAGDLRDIDRAIDMTQRARNAAVRYELRSEETYATAMLAEFLLWKGDLTGAENMAIEVLGSHPHAEMVAWRILGTLQARRGAEEADESLRRVWSLARESGELQNIDPAASALAEQAWIKGNLDDELRNALVDVIERGNRSGYVWPSGALAFWTWKLGILTDIPERLSPFYRLTMTGAWRDAAAFWEARHAPYDLALALMHGDQDSRVHALRIFEDLGADATATRLRHELRDAGLTVPRGPARSTRRHAAGLTARQAEVLDLLDEGLTNAEIADRLFVSARTVENHVAAILMKLDAPNRRAAVESARSAGLLDP